MEEGMDDDVDLSSDDINALVKFISTNKKKICIAIVMLSIIAMLYYLGYVTGFKDAFAGQNEYFKSYMANYCTCFLHL